MENRKMIYLVEDDESIRELVIYTLKVRDLKQKDLKDLLTSGKPWKRKTCTSAP